METYKEIEKYVRKKSKQGYEGYKDTLAFFRKYNLEQLDYIELNAKIEHGINEQTKALKDIFPILISIIAVTLSAFFDEAKNNGWYLEKLSYFIIILIIWFAIWHMGYILIEAGAHVKSERVLFFVKQTKKEIEGESRRGISVDETEKAVKTYCVTVCEK